MSEKRVCVCGHRDSSHYQFILNNKPATRCRDCPDPLIENPSVNIAVDGDSYLWALRMAAEHPFEERQQ